MKNLLKLLSILQLTKEQPCTGYLSAGVRHTEAPSLAEHHYTTTLNAYFILQRIKKAGGIIDERKVLLMLMIHDLPELFGGDIAAPLNRKYPDLREYKNKIGERAVEMMCDFLEAEEAEEFKKTHEELDSYTTDESVVAKIFDQMDHQFFLEHLNYHTKYNHGKEDYRDAFVKNHILSLTAKIKDEKTKKVMDDFLLEFWNNYFNKGFQGFTFLMDP